MNYKIKDNLFLIISLSLVAIITVVLLIVLVDCEKEKPRVDPIEGYVEVYSGENAEDKIGEYTFTNFEEDWNISLNYDGYAKIFKGHILLSDGRKIQATFGGYLMDDGVTRWTIPKIIADKGYYKISMGVAYVANDSGYLVHFNLYVTIK